MQGCEREDRTTNTKKTLNGCDKQRGKKADGPKKG